MWDFRNFERRARRILGIALLIALSVAAANAYTIVMRGGKRMEIPARFVVTPTTLTYEVGQGIQVTLLMTAIDIPATEKANNEQPGALLRRAQLPAEQSASNANATQSSSAKRTITNRDLEATSRRRRESERAYDQRIKAMGLPSLAESRAQAEAESAAIGRELERMRTTEEQSEAYWRSRASALRTEMAALDAEINYLRAKIEEMPVANWSGGSFSTFSTIVPFISFGNFGGRRHFPGHRANRAGVYVAPTGVGPQLSGRLRFGGGATRAQVFVNPHPFGHRRTFGVGGPSFGISNPFGVLPNVPVFSSSFPAYDNSYERGALIVRFNELAAARAGLNATWRELEDEARRAGAPPGWLRK